jgi:twitching motility protein PilJ
MDDRPFLKSISGKIATAVLVTSMVPLFLLGGAAIISILSLKDSADDSLAASREDLADDVVGAGLATESSLVARELDIFMRERISDATVWASDPTVIEAARAGALLAEEEGLVGQDIDAIESRFGDNVARVLPVPDDAGDYLASQITESSHFGEVFFTDANGFNVAITAQTSDFVQSDEDWWIEAFDAGISVGDVEYDDSAGIWAVDISVAVIDPKNDERLGVMKTVLGVSLIQEIADLYAEQIESGQVTVMTSGGLILAETATDHQVSRIMSEDVNLTDSGSAGIQEGLAAQAANRVPDSILGEETVSGHASTAESEFYADTVEGFDGFGWVVVVEQPSAVAFRALEGLEGLQSDLATSGRNMTILIAVVVLLVAVVAIAVGLRLARSFSVPILRLRDVAEKVSLGDLDTKVDVTSDDEIGDLAESFSRMVVAVKFLAADEEELTGV